MKRRLDWQKRALILFAALILVLSVVLTALAIREAEREKLLAQRETNDEARKTADLVCKQINDRIAEAEARVLTLLKQSEFRSDHGPSDQLSGRIQESEPLVSEIIYVAEDGEVRFPHCTPLYLLSGEDESAGQPQAETEGHRLFKAAEIAEFQKRDYGLASQYYKQLMTSTADRASRALLLNAIARCYVNSGHPFPALETYELLLKDYAEEVGPDGIPLGAIALFQMGLLYSHRNNEQDSAQRFLELYAALLEPKWLLSRAQFEFYLSKVKKELAGLAARMEGVTSKAALAERQAALQKLENAKQKRMNVIEGILTNVIPIIKARNLNSASGSEHFVHMSGTAGGRGPLVSYMSPGNNVVLGFTLDDAYLKNELISSVMAAVPLREGWTVQIVDRERRILFGEDLPPADSRGPRTGYAREFAGDFPPWTVHIDQAVPSLAERQFRQRRMTYVLSVVVVIAALLFGGFLAIRSTAKELKLARLKSEFVSTVSHEFRTPLTSIRYLADLLKRGRVTRDDRKQEYYETITHESERLSRLIENILDFSKIEAGMKEYEFAELDLSELGRDVVSRFKEQAALQDFTIESHIPPELPRVSGDREALSRALFNLLDNAVKYSGDSRRIFLRVDSDESFINLAVEDEGVGISKEEQQRVFEKFYRSGSSQESSVKGSGIGLTIVDHVVKAHGGDVLLESEPGQGTKVTIRLPRQPALTRG